MSRIPVQKVFSDDDHALPIFAEFNQVANRVRNQAYKPFCRRGCGRICTGRRRINLSIAFARQTVGIREVEDRIWQISFLECDLGYFDNERVPVPPGPDPFALGNVSTMCPE